MKILWFSCKIQAAKAVAKPQPEIITRDHEFFIKCKKKIWKFQKDSKKSVLKKNYIPKVFSLVRPISAPSVLSAMVTNLHFVDWDWYLLYDHLWIYNWYPKNSTYLNQYKGIQIHRVGIRNRFHSIFISNLPIGISHFITHSKYRVSFHFSRHLAPRTHHHRQEIPSWRQIHIHFQNHLFIPVIFKPTTWKSVLDAGLKIPVKEGKKKLNEKKTRRQMVGQ